MSYSSCAKLMWQKFATNSNKQILLTKPERMRYLLVFRQVHTTVKINVVGQNEVYILYHVLLIFEWRFCLLIKSITFDLDFIWEGAIMERRETNSDSPDIFSFRPQNTKFNRKSFINFGYIGLTCGWIFRTPPPPPSASTSRKTVPLFNSKL
jgi:hypothetical protein